MSTYGLLSLGTSGMAAAQAQLQTTGHNIANASVEGYSRQKAMLSTTAGQYSGSGYIGRGVTVQTVTREVSSFLTDKAAQTQASAAADQSRQTMLEQLQSSFGTGENGIGYATSNLFNAWSDLASNPGDSSARQVVLARADDLASMVRNTSDQLDTLQSSVNDEVKTKVSSVNEMAKQVAALNQQIAGYQGQGQTPNDLFDQRDQLVSQISQQVQVTRLEQKDGSMSLFVGGGQSLVLGANAYQLTAHPDTNDQSHIAIGVKIASSERPLGADALGGGALQGLLKFQNDDLSAVRSQLDTLAGSIASQVNQQQSLGVRADGQTGTALFSVSAKQPAGSMRTLLSQPADLAVASPVSVSAAQANTGTAKVASFSFSSTDTMPSKPMTLAFTDNNGAYTIQDASGTVAASGTWSAGQPIKQFGFELQLSGVPKKNDVLTLAKTVDPASNNGNALAMAGLANQANTAGATYTDAYASTLSDIGVRVQGATSAASVSSTVAAKAKEELSSRTGVNLDEEAARLIQYQQSYQAAAKVLQVAQKVFDTLLSLGS
jgi:flagellar hook-associated protein 1 FlgK